MEEGKILWKRYKTQKLEYYKPQKVINSLTKKNNLENNSEINSVYSDVLFSIGNNHSGTYYPVIEDALPIIIEIAKKGKTEVCRNCALEILSDLNYCFSPSTENQNILEKN